MRLISMTFLCLAGVAAAQGPNQQLIHSAVGIALPLPPSVAEHPIVDTYSVANAPNVQVTDNYRWLEDAKSPETRAFIASENAYTQKYFDQLKALPEVRSGMDQLLRTDFLSPPQQRGDRFFFSRRAADENQASIYMRVGLHGPDQKLVDAASLSADQNTSVNIVEI